MESLPASFNLSFLWFETHLISFWTILLNHLLFANFWCLTLRFIKGILGCINAAHLTLVWTLWEKHSDKDASKFSSLFLFLRGLKLDTVCLQWELRSPAVALKYFHRLCSVPWPHVLKYRLGNLPLQTLDDVPVSVDGKRVVFFTFGCLHTR